MDIIDYQHIPAYHHNSQTFFFKFTRAQDEVVPYYEQLEKDTIVYKPEKSFKIIQEGIPYHKNDLKNFISTKPVSAINSRIRYSSPSKTDWISCLLLFSIIIFVFVRFNYFKRLNLVLQSVVYKRYYNQLLRECDYQIEPMSYLLSFNFITAITLTLYFVYYYFQHLIKFNTNNHFIFLTLIAGVFGLTLLKDLIVRFSGYLFGTKEDAENYRITVSILNQTSAIVAIPLLIFYAYTQLKIFLQLAIIAFIVFFVLRFIKVLVMNIWKSKFTTFYLFLYLCTVEILPIFILTKLIIRFL